MTSRRFHGMPHPGAIIQPQTRRRPAGSSDDRYARREPPQARRVARIAAGTRASSLCQQIRFCEFGRAPISALGASISLQIGPDRPRRDPLKSAAIALTGHAGRERGVRATPLACLRSLSPLGDFADLYLQLCSQPTASVGAQGVPHRTQKMDQHRC
jgi:hypothetical protein